MASYDSVWVKIVNLDQDLTFLHENYNSKAELSADTTFACAKTNISDGEFPDDLLEELSQHFEEVIFMDVQTTVDLFLYAHWKNGQRTREISYCANDGWYLVNGNQESWEKILFQEEEKLRQLSYLDLEHLANNPNRIKEYQIAQQTAAEIEEIWTQAKLCEGYFYPMATASELYHLVKQHFKLTNG